MKYAKKPITVEAVQFNYRDMQFPGRCDCPEELLPHIHTLEGIMIPALRDWIITGVEGEHYPCKPGIFEKTYEEWEEQG